MPAPTFYSKAERAVEGAKGGVFDKKGMTTTDKAISLFVKEKKGDKQWQVPEAEVEWSGVVDWLEGRKEHGAIIAKDARENVQKMNKLLEEVEKDPVGYKRGSEMHKKDIAEAKYSVTYWEKALIKGEAQAAGKVSKADILKFLQNKGVKVEEVYRSGSNTDMLREKYADQMAKRFEVVKEKDPDDPLAHDYVIYDENGEIYRGEGGGIISFKSPLDAEANLRDRLFDEAMRMPDQELREYVEGGNLSGSKGPTLFQPGESDWVMLPGDEKAQQSYGELVLTLPEDKAKTHETFELPSSHRFPESNILAHIRFTERVDADGKKMLFIEELQSDWSNEGRRDGWKQERPARVQKHIVKLRKEKSRIVQETGAFNHPKAEALDARIRNLEFEHPINSGGAPDMPFKGDNRYGALALKRMIRWASDNGFDRLGWITGKDTAERYNLSKQVDRVTHRKLEGDEYEVNLYPKGHSEVVTEKGTLEYLEGVVGKDLVKKIKNNEGETLEVNATNVMGGPTKKS